MKTLTPSLPGMDVVRDAGSLYGEPREVYIDSLSRFSDKVVIGMRREMERLERAGIAAFADGRRIWTPTGSFFIELNGQPSSFLNSEVDFDARAHHAAKRMETRTGFSFNHTFSEKYLKEESNA